LKANYICVLLKKSEAMRLGQLARKLAQRPAEIVDFLAENNIRIADGTNARLEKDQVTLIMKRFVPGWIEVIEVDTEPEIEVETTANEPAADASTADEGTSFTIESDLQQEVPADANEVIRAPKVELSGLKVVGKIDLPEPKKKEEPSKEEGSAIDESKKEWRENRKTFDVNRNRRPRPEKNPVALQREKEAKEAQKKRLEQQAREKEKRTQKYLKNYKPASPTKAAKLVKEAVVEMTAQELEEPPKTLFGKILRWLTKAS
jgi:hypothetical protein